MSKTISDEEYERFKQMETALKKTVQALSTYIRPESKRRSPTGEQLFTVYNSTYFKDLSVDAAESLQRVQLHILTELRKDIAKEQERLSGFGWELWNVVDKVLQRWLKENE